jgi:multiple sugar transport system permease protein
MVAPALLVLTAFVLLPIAASVYMAFTRYDLFTPPEWSGLRNFGLMLSDKRLWKTFGNTVFVSLFAVLGNNLLGLLLAMGVNRKMPTAYKYFLRTAFFFPVLTTASSLAIVWRFLLGTDRGVVNWVLGQFGIGRIMWLSSSTWALRSVVLYQVWRSVGFSMVIYLAGLQGIPRELYESARIDGAGAWRLTRHITLPLLSPSTFFNVVMGFIGGFQIFEASQVLTGGGPGDGSRTLAVYLYEVAFREFEMGYGAAVALVLALLLVCLTMLQFWIGNRWVHYD